MSFLYRLTAVALQLVLASASTFLFADPYSKVRSCIPLTVKVHPGGYYGGDVLTMDKGVSVDIRQDNDTVVLTLSSEKAKVNNPFMLNLYLPSDKLRSLEVMGGGTLYVSEGFEVNKLKINAYLGNVRVDGIKAKHVKVFAKGAGTVAFNGTVNHCSLTSKGTTKVLAYGVQKSMEARLDGSSAAYISGSPDKKIFGVLSDMSNIYVDSYSGCSLKWKSCLPHK